MNKWLANSGVATTPSGFHSIIVVDINLLSFNKTHFLQQKLLHELLLYPVWSSVPKVRIVKIRIVLILKISSLKHPAKYVGRKPRKYTVPVPVAGSGEASASLTGKTHIGDHHQFHHQLNFYPLFSGNVASSSLAARASGRGRPQGVDPLAAQVSR